MKKSMSILLLLLFPSLCFAEDIYCGDYNDMPVYVRTESIDYHSYQSDGAYRVYTQEHESGFDIQIHPVYNHYYTAHLIIESDLYHVAFSPDRQSSFSVTKILRGYKDETHDIDLSFAYPIVKKHYNSVDYKIKRKYLDDFELKRSREQTEDIHQKDDKDRISLLLSSYRRNKAQIDPYYDEKAPKKKHSFGVDSKAVEQQVYREHAEIAKNDITRKSTYFSADQLRAIADELELTPTEKNTLFYIAIDQAFVDRLTDIYSMITNYAAYRDHINALPNDMHHFQRRQSAIRTAESIVTKIMVVSKSLKPNERQELAQMSTSKLSPVEIKVLIEGSDQ